jgi:hypothetical protein
VVGEPHAHDAAAARGKADALLKMTTDFRRVYTTMIKEWLGYDDPDVVLKGRYETLGAFA